MCLIGKPVTGCYTTYMWIGWAYIPMLILCYFEYTTVVKKYQNETALIKLRLWDGNCKPI